MAQAPEFKYAPMFQLGKDDTEYYLLTKEYVSVGDFEGHPILKVEAEGLTQMINTRCVLPSAPRAQPAACEDSEGSGSKRERQVCCAHVPS